MCIERILITSIPYFPSNSLQDPTPHHISFPIPCLPSIIIYIFITFKMIYLFLFLDIGVLPAYLFV